MHRGAYGLTLAGVDGIDRFLLDAPVAWPVVTLRLSGKAAPAGEDFVDDARGQAEVAVSGGRVRLLRNPLHAVFAKAAPTMHELVHPVLSPVAVVAGHWLGRESYHAGAFVVDGAAWAVVGDRESGKSSTLGRLALDRVDILCDDVVVLEVEADSITAMAGPRAIDLREEASARLGVGEDLGTVGARDRWRVPLGEVSPEVPLRGWIFLSWGDQLASRPLPVGERLVRIARSRALRIPPRRPEVLMQLAALPGIEVSRPRRWDTIGETVALLVAAAGGS